MNYKEEVAHHEAAHVVMSHLFGGGPATNGININTASSVQGASGNAGVCLIVHDETLCLEDQHHNLIRNVAIICAGAAADARTTKVSIEEAMKAQPSDWAAAWAEINNSPLVTTSEEGAIVYDLGVQQADRALKIGSNWDLVEKIAKACVANNGMLSKSDIDDLLLAS